MKLYILLEGDRITLLTEYQAKNLGHQGTLHEIIVPWKDYKAFSRGGKGSSPYPPGPQTTMRVPKRLVRELKQISIWLAQKSAE